MKTPKEIIEDAIRLYDPVKILLMFSGGHDSLCASYRSSMILNDMGIPFKVYHGNTGIGIEETRDFVRSVCSWFGWELVIRKPEPPYDYNTFVQNGGFPGPSMHPIMYRNLKEKPLRKYITHEVKSSPMARENVLLLTGIRQSESAIRMGYKETVRKDDSRIWASPIFYWSGQDCERFMKKHDLPRNSVKDRICISGECLCGAFGGREELAEIKAYCDESGDPVFQRIQALHHTATKNGFPWGWSSDPLEYKKHNPPGVPNMFTGEVFMPMCVGCNSKHVP